MQFFFLSALALVSSAFALTILNATSIEDALDTYAKGGIPSDTTFLIGNETHTSFVTNFRLVSSQGNSGNLGKSLTKRWESRWESRNQQQRTIFTEWRVVDQGFSYLEWQPASSCMHTGSSSAPTRFQQNWAQSTDWKADAEFLFDFAKLFAAKLGAQVLTLFNANQNWEVSIPPNLVGQTWTRKRVVWQDQQKRQCERIHDGPDGLLCLEWSQKMRGYLPDSSPYNTEVRHENVRC